MRCFRGKKRRGRLVGSKCRYLVQRGVKQMKLACIIDEFLQKLFQFTMYNFGIGDIEFTDESNTTGEMFRPHCGVPGGGSELVNAIDEIIEEVLKFQVQGQIGWCD